MLPASSTGKLVRVWHSACSSACTVIYSAHGVNAVGDLQGIISASSIEKAAALRKMGAAFVIVSGARTATVLQRLPYLPAADAVIAENGKLEESPPLEPLAQSADYRCNFNQRILKML